MKFYRTNDRGFAMRAYVDEETGEFKYDMRKRIHTFEARGRNHQIPTLDIFETHRVFTDKDEANNFFRQTKEMYPTLAPADDWEVEIK